MDLTMEVVKVKAGKVKSEYAKEERKAVRKVLVQRYFFAENFTKN